jgi:hypothetical protein
VLSCWRTFSNVPFGGESGGVLIGEEIPLTSSSLSASVLAPSHPRINLDPHSFSPT